MFEPDVDAVPDMKEESNQDDNQEAPADDASPDSVPNTPNPGMAALELLPEVDKQFLLTYPVNKKCFCGTDGMFYEAKIKKYYTAGGQLLLLVHFEVSYFGALLGKKILGKEGYKLMSYHD